MNEIADYLRESLKEHQQIKELFENKDWDGLKRFSKSLLKKYKLRKIDLEKEIPLLQDRIDDEFFPLKPEYGKQHYEEKLWEMKDELSFVKKQIVSLEDEIKDADDLKKREKELWNLELLQLRLESESNRKQIGDKIDQWIDKNIPNSNHKDTYKRVFEIINQHPNPNMNDYSAADFLKYVHKQYTPDLGDEMLRRRIPNFVRDLPL